MEKSLYKVQTRYLFHAHIRIKIPAKYPDSLLQALFSILQHIDTTYNSFTAGSYTDRINRQAGSFVEVDEETIHILKRVLEISSWLHGQYDITIMPLWRLWGFPLQTAWREPSERQIQEVRKRVDYRNIQIEKSRVRIGKGQEITTGSFLKGYAVDRVMDKLKEEGVEDAIVNAGGSTIACLNDTSHPCWQVVIHDPVQATELFRLPLSNECCSTSAPGIWEIAGRKERRSHILDPVTGYLCDNLRTTVLTRSALTGDIFSTAFQCPGRSGFLSGMRKLARKVSVAGFQIDRAGHIICTPEMEKYGFTQLLPL